jgi:hypothetical protein
MAATRVRLADRHLVPPRRLSSENERGRPRIRQHEEARVPAQDQQVSGSKDCETTGRIKRRAARSEQVVASSDERLDGWQPNNAVGRSWYGASSISAAIAAGARARYGSARAIQKKRSAAAGTRIGALCPLPACLSQSCYVERHLTPLYHPLRPRRCRRRPSRVPQPRASNAKRKTAAAPLHAHRLRALCPLLTVTGGSVHRCAAAAMASLAQHVCLSRLRVGGLTFSHDSASVMGGDE